MFACTNDMEVRFAQLTNKVHELSARLDALKDKEDVEKHTTDIASLTLDNKTRGLQIAALETAIRGTAEICTSSSERYALALTNLKNDLRILSDTLSDMIVRTARLETRSTIDFASFCDVVGGDISSAKKPLLLVSKDTTVVMSEETPDTMTFFNATSLPITITVKEDNESITLRPLRGVVLHLEIYRDTKCLLEDAITYFGVPGAPCTSCE